LQLIKIRIEQTAVTNKNNRRFIIDLPYEVAKQERGGYSDDKSGLRNGHCAQVQVSPFGTVLSVHESLPVF
jgi:hypothetical protein